MTKPMTILIATMMLFSCNNSNNSSGSTGSGIFSSNSSFTVDNSVLYAISKLREPNEFLERIAQAKQNGMDDELQIYFARSACQNPN